jgi:hypothetical protein
MDASVGPLVMELRRRLAVVLEEAQGCDEKISFHQSAIAHAEADKEPWLAEERKIRALLGDYEPPIGETLGLLAEWTMPQLRARAPTPAVLEMVDRAGRIRQPEVIEELAAAIRAGQITTTAKDPRKLASSTIAQLVRTGVLRRDRERFLERVAEAAIELQRSRGNPPATSGAV